MCSNTHTHADGTTHSHGHTHSHAAASSPEEALALLNKWFPQMENFSGQLKKYQVTIDDLPVDLTLMEYSLLSFLATHPSRAYSRETLLHRVWGFEYCGGTRTVDVHIRRLREKIEEDPKKPDHIITVWGVGYRFE